MEANKFKGGEIINKKLFVSLIIICRCIAILSMIWRHVKGKQEVFSEKTLKAWTSVEAGPQKGHKEASLQLRRKGRVH